MQNNKIKFNGITIEVKTVTPEMAADILTNHNLNNRNVSKSHVKVLLQNMKTNAWRFNGDSIRFDENGNLIDGQHRLNALKEYGQPLPMLLISGFDEQTIRTIDQEIKPRNLGDLFKMNGVANSNAVAGVINRYFAMRMASSFLNSERSGHSGISGQTFKNSGTIEDKYNEYFSQQTFYDDTVAYALSCYRKTRMLRPSEIGGVYTFLYFVKHHSDDEIRGFFNRLCFTETDINVINLLRDLFVRDFASKNPMTSANKSAYLTKAWNYYIKGKDVKVLSYNKNTEGTIEFI